MVHVFGIEQSVVLHLLDIAPAIEVLEAENALKSKI